MQYRNLGNLTHISALGLGCMGMSEFYGKTDLTESKQVIQRAFDLGVNFYDTADMYGYGENEVLVGDAVKQFRNKVIIATKCGIMRSKQDPTLRGVNNRPEYIQASCDASLQRLKMDHIDLYYIHRIDPATPIEDSVGALSDLVKAGKVRYIGLSEANADTIRRAHKVHPLTAIQTEYSLWYRSPETSIFNVCRELNIGFVPYSPIGRGFLTGKIQDATSFDSEDFRQHLPRFQQENFAENLKMVQKIQAIAAAKNCTAAQLALAWVLAQGDYLIPIPGTKRLKYLVENTAAIDITLSTDELAQLNNIAAKENFQGMRYTQEALDVYQLEG